LNIKALKKVFRDWKWLGVWIYYSCLAPYASKWPASSLSVVYLVRALPLLLLSFFLLLLEISSPQRTMWKLPIVSFRLTFCCHLLRNNMYTHAIDETWHFAWDILHELQFILFKSRFSNPTCHYVSLACPV
jgi:hypothetical protein